MTKKKRGFNLGEWYKESWNYIRASKKFIWIVIGIFLVFALVGYFAICSTR